MARLHFPLIHGSSNWVRIRKLNDDDVARMPSDLPESEPPPAPVPDALVQLTIFDDAGDALPGYENVELPPYGDPAFASYKTLLEEVDLIPGQYDGRVVITRLDGAVVKRAALVSVSDE